MSFAGFLIILIIIGILALGSIIGICVSQCRATAIIWLVVLLVSLGALFQPLSSVLNPTVLATDRKEEGYFYLVPLDTNLACNPYLISYQGATEFRYWKDDQATTYKTVKGQYVDIAFMTQDEATAVNNGDTAPAVRIMWETNTPIYSFYGIKVKAPTSLENRGVIRFYFNVPQDRVIIE